MEIIFSEMSKGKLNPFIDTMAEDIQWTWIGTGKWSHTFLGKEAVVNELLAAVKEILTEPYEIIPQRFIAEVDFVVVEHTPEKTLPLTAVHTLTNMLDM